MKKTIVLAVATFFSLAALFIACKKESSSKEQKQAIPNQMAHAKSYNQGGVTCDCAGDVCGANCLFTACCICINPGEQGACSCSFGVSRCMTVVPSKDGGKAAISGLSDNINFYPDNISDLFTYCNAHEYQINSVVAAYNTMLSNSTVVADQPLSTRHVSVPQNYYDFVAAYEQFTNSLTTEQQADLQHFVDQHP